MIRILLALVIGAVIFVATLAGILFITGNLNQEAINRIAGREEPTFLDKEEPLDELGPILAQIKEERAALEKRARDLDAQDDQLRLKEQSLEQMRKQVEDLQQQIQDTLGQEDTARLGRLQRTAKVLSSMDPTSAAKVLDEFPVEDAVEVLMEVKEAVAGEILDVMDAQRATHILQEMKSARI